MSIQDQPQEAKEQSTSPKTVDDNPIPGNLSPARQASIARAAEVKDEKPVFDTETSLEEVLEDEIEHVVTEDDLKRHPSLEKDGVLVGDILEISKVDYQDFLDGKPGEALPVDQEGDDQVL